MKSLEIYLIFHNPYRKIKPAVRQERKATVPNYWTADILFIWFRTNLESRIAEKVIGFFIFIIRA